MDPHLTRRRRARREANRALRQAARQVAGSGSDDGGDLNAALARTVKGLIGDKLNLPARAFTPEETRRCLRDRGVPEALIRQAVELLEDLEVRQFASKPSAPEEQDVLVRRTRKLVAILDRKL